MSVNVLAPDLNAEALRREPESLGFRSWVLGWLDACAVVHACVAACCCDCEFPGWHLSDDDGLFDSWDVAGGAVEHPFVVCAEVAAVATVSADDHVGPAFWRVEYVVEGLPEFLNVLAEVD